MPSKENNASAVPDTEATVTVPIGTLSTVAEDMRHSTVVPLVHDDVEQATDATLAVGVRSSEAKARPLRVAVAPPEEGALLAPTLAQVSTGAWKCMQNIELENTDMRLHQNKRNVQRQQETKQFAHTVK